MVYGLAILLLICLICLCIVTRAEKPKIIESDIRNNMYRFIKKNKHNFIKYKDTLYFLNAFYDVSYYLKMIDDETFGLFSYKGFLQETFDKDLYNTVMSCSKKATDFQIERIEENEEKK